MAKDFLDIDEKIERNETYLKFYYSNYQRTQGKITVLTLIYSVIAIYLIQVLKYPFNAWSDSAWYVFSLFLIFLGAFLFFLIQSIFNTYKLLETVRVAYMDFPKVFYDDIRKEYEQSLNTTNQSVLNEYVKHTYLSELEFAVERN